MQCASHPGKPLATARTVCSVRLYHQIDRKLMTACMNLLRGSILLVIGTCCVIIVGILYNMALHFACM